MQGIQKKAPVKHRVQMFLFATEIVWLAHWTVFYKHHNLSKCRCCGSGSYYSGRCKLVPARFVWKFILTFIFQIMFLWPKICSSKINYSKHRIQCCRSGSVFLQEVKESHKHWYRKTGFSLKFFKCLSEFTLRLLKVTKKKNRNLISKFFGFRKDPDPNYFKSNY